MTFDFKQSKQNIIKIINSKTKVAIENKIPQDATQISEDGMKSWCTSICITLKNVSNLYKGYNAEVVTKIMRSFCSESISLLSTNTNYRQIEIRGGTIIGIYSTATKSEIYAVFLLACQMNTFLRMFNAILAEYLDIYTGIGISCSEQLIIKTGKKDTAIDSTIWLGEAVKDSLDLANLANTDDVGGIAMSSLFFHNLKSYYEATDDDTLDGISYSYDHEVYHANLVIKDVNNWINKGMK